MTRIRWWILLEIEDKGENELKKNISFKSIVLVTAIGKLEKKNESHISNIDKFVLFSVLGS